MVTKKKKETTIDDLALEMRAGFEDLARMTAKGFESVDKRFEQVDKRFEQIDRRFEQVDARFDQMDRRFDRMDERMETLEESNSMEHEEMKTHLGNVAYKFELTELGKRVRILEKKIK